MHSLGQFSNRITKSILLSIFFPFVYIHAHIRTYTTTSMKIPTASETQSRFYFLFSSRKLLLTNGWTNETIERTNVRKTNEEANERADKQAGKQASKRMKKWNLVELCNALSTISLLILLVQRRDFSVCVCVSLFVCATIELFLSH